MSVDRRDRNVSTKHIEADCAAAQLTARNAWHRRTGRGIQCRSELGSMGKQLQGSAGIGAAGPDFAMKGVHDAVCEQSNQAHGCAGDGCTWLRDCGDDPRLPFLPLDSITAPAMNAADSRERERERERE